MSQEALDEFARLMAELLSIDNDVRRAAELRLPTFKDDADVFLACALHCMRTATNEGAREMACVITRQFIFAPAVDSTEENPPPVWASNAAELRNYFATEILSLLRTEPARLVVRKLADLAAEAFIYSVAIDAPWSELLTFLVESAGLESPQLREMAFMVFTRFGQQTAAALESHGDDLYTHFFAAGLVDPESMPVRVAALSATAQFLCGVDDERESGAAVLRTFRAAVPPMLETISAALAAGDLLCSLKAVQFFIDVAECTPSFFRESIVDVTASMLEIVSSELPAAIRHLALEFLTMLCEAAPGMMRKVPSFVPNFFTVGFALLAGVEDTPGWQHEDDSMTTEIGSPEFAEQALDRLAVALGGGAVLPVVHQVLEQLMADGAWQARHAGLMGTSAMLEGLRQVLEPGLASLVRFMGPFLSDPHPRVRYAACQLFGQLAVDFAPGFQNTFHSSVIPALLDLTNDSENPRTQGHATAALLNNTCDLEVPVLVSYLPTVLARLGDLIRGAARPAQESALSCLSQVVIIVTDAFDEYYDTFMPLLHEILATEDPELELLRAKAVEAIASIVQAVGVERSRDDGLALLTYMQRAGVSALAPDEVRAPFYVAAIGRLASTLGESFVPFMDDVLPALIQAASVPPDYVLLAADESPEVTVGWAAVTISSARVLLNTSALEDKAAAVRMLVTVVRDLQDLAWNYIDELAKLAVSLINFYFNDPVRIAAIDMLPFLLTATVTYVDKAGNPADGLEYLNGLASFVLSHLLEGVFSEPDLEIVCAGVESLAECIDALGAGALDADTMAQCAQVLAQLLVDREKRAKNRAKTRKTVDYDDETGLVLDDQFQLDILILRVIVKANEKLLRHYGTEYFAIFAEQLVPLLVPLLDATRPMQERQWSLCPFADMIEWAAPASEALMHRIAPLFLELAVCDNCEVRQVCVYALGQIATSYPAVVAGASAQAVIDALRTATSFPVECEDDLHARDNCASALMRMARASSDAAMVTELVGIMMGAIPCGADSTEGVATYRFLLDMLDAQLPALVSVPERMVTVGRAFVFALGTEFADELEERMVAFLRTLAETAQPVFQALTDELDDDSKTKIASIFA